MKKVVCFLLTVIAVCFSFYGVYANTAPSAVTVYVNGEMVVFDQPPIIFKDRTLVPIRAVTEKMGATVEWREDRSDEVTVTLGDRFVSVRIGNLTLLTGLRENASEDKRVELDVPPYIINSRTLLPIRAVVENLGGTVEWDGNKNTINITCAVEDKENPSNTMLYRSGGKYEGEVSENRIINGYGKMTLMGGEYEGEFKDGVFHGFGKLTFADGNYYEGQWSEGTYNGNGKLALSIGVIEGNFENGEINGKAKITFANGNVYEGDFKDTLPDGQGVCTFKNGDVFEGSFKDSAPNGFGRFIYANGTVYEGDVIGGSFAGKGKYTFTDGTVAEGEWIDGEFIEISVP